MGTRTGTAGTRRKTTTALSVATGLLLAATALPCAGASAAGRYTPLTHPFQDSNWGGYVARGSFTSIIGSWVEPHVTCRTTSDLFAPWVGIDGYGSQTVEQTGVQTDCSTGSPVRTPWYEMYPAPPVYWKDPVSEGDTMTASVVATGTGHYVLTLSDVTRGWSEHVDQAVAGQDVSAEAVIESPTQAYPLFDQLRFSSVTVDRQVFDLTAPTALSSGGYAPGPLHLGAFAMLPGVSAALRRPHPVRPRVVRYHGPGGLT